VSIWTLPLLGLGGLALRSGEVDFEAGFQMPIDMGQDCGWLVAQAGCQAACQSAT